ncbi:MAG: CYTH domain-containing protein [Chloroflexota bacterium]|nr:CYTH domain-containing protein [Chloroflexota bacterium]
MPNGRLKLRQGLIENNLILYAREDRAGPKQSGVILYGTRPGSDLKALLTGALGTVVTVEKRREIYFVAVDGVGLDGVENIKVHLDTVEGLGTFVEIEAIERDGSIGPERLRAQCERLMSRLGIRDRDLVADSYSDLLLVKVQAAHG